MWQGNACSPTRSSPTSSCWGDPNRTKKKKRHKKTWSGSAKTLFIKFLEFFLRCLTYIVFAVFCPSLSFCLDLADHQQDNLKNGCEINV